MAKEGLEKRIVQMLTCESNLPVLKQIICEKYGTDFTYVSSEIPIVANDGYRYVDLMGRDEGEDAVAFFECKANRSLYDKAVRQAKENEGFILSNGLLQAGGLIGIYHYAILSQAYVSERQFSVRPLILDKETIIRCSGYKFKEVFSRFKDFMLDRCSRAYKIAPEYLEDVIPPDAVPVYVYDLLEKGKRRSHVAYVTMNGPLASSKLTSIAKHAALKLPPDSKNYEVLLKLEKAGTSGNRFSIQFPTQGHSRPMIFFEINDEFSACFVHEGRHNVELVGYYETEKVLKGKDRIYGLVEADLGRYSVEDLGNNRINLKLQGRFSEGEIELKILDKIFLEDRIRLLSGPQTSLEDYWTPEIRTVDR